MSLAELRKITEEAASSSARTSTAAATSSRPSARSRSSDLLGCRHHDGARRVHRPAGRARARPRAPMDRSLRWARALQGGAFAARATGLRPVRHRPGRHRPGPARRAPPSAGRRWASTATRSAASRSASRRPMFDDLDADRARLLPADRPRYLMGVGKPDRHDRAVAARGRHVRLRAADPLRPHRPGLHPPGRSTSRTPATPTIRARSTDCACPACARLLARLPAPPVQAGEILGAMLLTWTQSLSTTRS